MGSYLVDLLLRHERQHDLNHNELLDLYSRLIESGLVWSLKGTYENDARTLIRAGFLDMAGNILVKANEV